MASLLWKLNPHGFQAAELNTDIMSERVRDAPLAAELKSLLFTFLVFFGENKSSMLNPLLRAPQPNSEVQTNS